MDTTTGSERSSSIQRGSSCSPRPMIKQYECGSSRLDVASRQPSRHIHISSHLSPGDDNQLQNHQKATARQNQTVQDPHTRKVGRWRRLSTSSRREASTRQSRYGSRSFRSWDWCGVGIGGCSIQLSCWSPLLRRCARLIRNFCWISLDLYLDFFSPPLCHFGEQIISLIAI